ncbi:MAG: hypothetical protein LBD59_10190 [Prevotellaceae bacterium]|jgi:hypothetical protein|nr:hypothetical protein [Prevotellaceae bacterium]
MRKLLKFTAIMLIMASAFACKKNENNSDVATGLKGTKWKLAGIVNEQTGAMQVLEPIDCQQCYTLEFDTDSIATGIAIKEKIGLNLSMLGQYNITDIMREPNEDKFIRSLFSQSTKSYAVTVNSLKFINTTDNYYLIFKKILQ